jgi:hypothetical protein
MNGTIYYSGIFRSGPSLILVSKEAPSVHLLIKTDSPEEMLRPHKAGHSSLGQPVHSMKAA